MSRPKPFDLEVAPEEQEIALKIQQDVDRGVAFLEKQQADPAIAAFKLAAEKAPVGSPVYDIITHNLLTAYRLRISQLLIAKDALHVNRYLPEVSALDLHSPLAEDAAFRAKFADTLRNLSSDFYNARQHQASLFFIRKALAVEPCPSYYIDLANAHAWLKSRALLSDFTKNYVEADLGRHIFIACAPKSGSTFLKNLLVGVTGFRDMFSVYASLQNEQELDLPQFIKFGTANTVTQQHTRASEPNIQIMQAFGVRPTVLVRDIFDTTASLLDFYTKGFTFSTFFDKEEFLSFDVDQKIELLIEYVLPWYFQFVASWQRAEREQRLEMNWVTYEEMIKDKPGTAEKILAYYGVKVPRGLIEQVIVTLESEKATNRINKGVAGRGQTVLSESQRDRIVSLGRHFPSADFSILGV